MRNQAMWKPSQEFYKSNNPSLATQKVLAAIESQERPKRATGKKQVNHFIHINSNGGYIGRWYWGNTGVHPSMEHWGSVHWLHNNILQTAWAGSFWAVRCICLHSSKP